ncbi:MAG: SUF system NifU family Fe-S cluster assembly protein [Thermoanaerobaculia bacterium]|nr:SUF system NifU family Fe-S cluster assembly protein [Thermoanaerobaculia bacterium]
MSLSEELRALYQEVILDHYKSPRNFGTLEAADQCADGYNPLCGDQFKVCLKMEDDRVAEAAFEGSGCAISTASASLMTEAVKGLRREQAEALFEDFHQLIAGAEPPDKDLGKLEVLAGVRDYPVRIKCATLAWHAMKSALAAGETVSTE